MSWITLHCRYEVFDNVALDGTKTLMTPDVVIMPWGHSSGLTPLAKAGYHAVNAYGWYLNEKLGWERYFAFDFMDDVDPSLTVEQIGLIEGGALSTFHLPACCAFLKR